MTFFEPSPSSSAGLQYKHQIVLNISLDAGVPGAIAGGHYMRGLGYWEAECEMQRKV
jgi:hypothetical protein